MATNITFNGYNLQTADPTNGVITSHIYDDNMPDVRLLDYELARQDGFKQVSSYFGNKSIKIDGLIKSVTASGLDGQVDLFKQNLYPKAVGQLIVARGTGNRLYNSYVKSVGITRDSFELTRAPFQVEFICEPGFGQEPTYTAFTVFSGVTQGSFQFDVATSGNAPYKPDINIKVQAASQFGNLTMKNLTTNDVIGVARTYSVGEVLDINTAAASVTVAGSGITYSGVMPTFIAVSGVNTLLFTAQSGTQTVDISVAYIPQWL